MFFGFIVSSHNFCVYISDDESLIVIRGDSNVRNAMTNAFGGEGHTVWDTPVKKLNAEFEQVKTGSVN